ncbi:MAG TPA: aminotransferase class I/II-fold pyridoxal phosphate-dependent enzyme [Chitinophagaceae bacterium]|nr:aminotransferase class I/II-fold pyridoxal phosphate-dependent enzyme [Chitinophagaceae bacterium]
MNSFAIHNSPGRIAIADGKEFLFFSGYSYLGMQHVPEFIALVKEGMEKYGWLFPSSRISNTQLELFSACETLLSAITGMEDTVLVSSGFLAGQLATEKWKHELINLSPSHPAIQRTGEEKIITDKKVYACDSVDVLHAAVTDFSFISSTEENIYIVDDSHGIGLLGENGEGISSRISANDLKNCVLTYSLSKAFHINGGAVSCTKSLADELRQTAVYTASTAPSPALLYAWLHGQNLYALQREKLKKNIALFRMLTRNLPLLSHEELPVFILQKKADENVLKDGGVIISSFAYPNPESEKIQRVVVNSLHTKEDLNYLTGCLEKIF